MLARLPLAAALPAEGQPALPTAGTGIPPDQGAYLQHMDAEMDTFRMKLHGMGERAEATGQQGATAEADLRAVWSLTEAEIDALCTATAAEWDGAKSSYGRTAQDFSRAWDKTRL